MAQQPRTTTRASEDDEGRPNGERLEVPAELIQKLRDEAVAIARKEMAKEVAEAMPGIRADIEKQLKLEAEAGGKIRRVDARENQRQEAELIKADLRGRLAASAIVGELPKGRVKFLVERLVHVSREDLDGEAGLSIEVQPSKDPIHLPEHVAKSLQAQGKGRII